MNKPSIKYEIKGIKNNKYITLKKGKIEAKLKYIDGNYFIAPIKSIFWKNKSDKDCIVKDVFVCALNTCKIKTFFNENVKPNDFITILTNFQIK